MKGYFEAMAFTRQEWDNRQILSHIFFGFDADGLIEDTWRFGPQESLNNSSVVFLEWDYMLHLRTGG